LGLFFSHETTHYVPPYGKFKPVKSEQQEKMEQVLKREEEVQKIINARPTIRMFFSNNAAFTHAGLTTRYRTESLWKTEKYFSVVKCQGHAINSLSRR